MKFNCGPTWKEKFYAKIQSKENWHRWFAWHPARVGYRDCRWLETVERKGNYVGNFVGADGYVGWDWEYRPLSNHKLNLSDTIIDEEKLEQVLKDPTQEEISARMLVEFYRDSQGHLRVLGVFWPKNIRERDNIEKLIKKIEKKPKICEESE